MNRLSALLLLFGCVLSAQDAAPKPADAAVDKEPERAIYIPYERLWQVFEKPGRGVFLPYEDYERLRKAAEEKGAKPTKEPVASLVAEVSGTVTIEGTVANVVASLRVEVLAKGWQRVPLGLRNVAITEAKLGDVPARLVYDPAAGYSLLVENADGKPKMVVLDLTFAKACVKSPGRNSVSFQPPPAPVGRWQIRIPEPGVKVDVKPVVAATEAATGKDGMTVVQAFVGAAPEIEIAWTPKAEGARGLQALVSAQSALEVQLGEGITRVRATVTSAITRAEIPGQTLVVPASYRVVNVFDENVRAWSVKKVGEEQDVQVEFFKPVQGNQVLLVELERLANEPVVLVPSIAVRGASREQGRLLVGVAEGLRAEVESRERLVQEDIVATANQKGEAAANWRFAYRFASVPYVLSFRLSKIEPRVLATSLAEVQLSPEVLRLDFTTILDVQRAGLFRIDLLVPEGYSVEDVAGVQSEGLRPANVEGQHLGEAQDGMVPLSVELRSRSLGRTGLRVRLARKLNEPSLLRPTQDSASFALAMPRLAMGEVERETGGLIVYAPGSLRVTPADVSGLRPVAVDAALNGVPSVQPQGVEVVLSYLYAEKGGRISFEARRRPPYVTVRQALRARFESASVRFDLTLFPEVRYSGIERLRLDLPADLPQVRSLTADVRLVPYRGDAPEDLAEGYTAWLLEPQTEFIGARTVQLTWESPMEALDVGKSVSMALPRPIVQGVDRTFGQILLDKAQGIDVQPEQSEGVRFIDPRHDLMAGLQAGGASVAFEFHGDWQLQARASRYEPQDVKVTSIERGLVRMVLTRGGVTSVQAVYKLSTMRQRLVLDLPEGASFDTQHLWLNGRSASLERGQGGTRLVPLQGLPQGKPFLLELRYTVPGGQVLMPPSFPEEPAVQKIYLSVHAPSEMAYLGHRGEWHPEFSWTFGDGGGLCPRGSRTDSNCMSWVCEGLSVDQQQLMNFATDGFHLLYSTLRPEPGDAGALRIVLMRTWQVRAILVLVILIVGALLIRASLAAKVAGAVGVFVAWVLVMMVLPSFGKSLLGNMALGATLVVGAVWFLWYVVALKPTLRLAQMARRPPPPPIPPAKADAEATDEPADQEGGTDHE